jgi:hypothetical protein
VAGSLTWGVLVDGFRPDRHDLVGAALCLAGVAVIMYAPRGQLGCVSKVGVFREKLRAWDEET